MLLTCPAVCKVTTPDEDARVFNSRFTTEVATRCSALVGEDVRGSGLQSAWKVREPRSVGSWIPSGSSAAVMHYFSTSRMFAPKEKEPTSFTTTSLADTGVAS